MPEICKKCGRKKHIRYLPGSLSNSIQKTWARENREGYPHDLCIECFIQEYEKINPTESGLFGKFLLLGISTEQPNFGGVLFHKGRKDAPVIFNLNNG